MDQKEQEFQSENGMSSHRAWEWVLQWSQEGKVEQAIKGCEEILRFFPDRDEVRHFYEKLMEVKIEQEEKGEEPDQAGGALGKLKGFLNEKAKKFQEMSAGDDKSAPSQAVENRSGIPSEEERLMGVLCYFWIFVLIPLFLKRDSAYVQFHAWQGLVLTGVMWVIHTVFISIFRYFNFGFLMFGVTALIVLVYAAGVLSAYKGIYLKMPIIYPISEKFRKMFEIPG